MRTFPTTEIPHPPALGERAAVVALVIAVHAGLLLAWTIQPELPAIVVNELSVSVAMQQAEVAREEATPIPTPAPVKPPTPVRVERSPEPAPAVHPMPEPPARQLSSQAEEVPLPRQAAETKAVAAAPVADTAPDYRAAYLDNPRPAYPMTARRMGWQGRVVLNVEVLASGMCGGISVAQGSGHEVLDNAAMRTVKGWRFVPATRGGQPVTQWFKVPIQFSLKENEA